MLLRIAPALFVLLWSTGFIASKVGAQHAEPFTFLSVRFTLVLAILVPWAVLRGTVWPHWRVALFAGLTGVLIHTAYLGGVLWALREGMAAGLVAIIVSTQPILTALLAGPLLGEWPGRRHWIGLGLGLIGVILVLVPRLTDASPAVTGHLSMIALFGALAALMGITLGTLNQKAHGMSGDLFGLTIIQYVAALGAALGFALAGETMQVDWTLDFMLALAWLVIVLSIGAIGLLLIMIRASAVSRVTSLFYLVPPTTALLAAGMLGEKLVGLQIAGIVLVMAAVFVIRPSAREITAKTG